ncbi:hypothetical protein [Edaphobacter acidisoli]|uniref:hypothetical protein n=1 Tax=Edaphobacter acidisoli TaxID=2040573 RepID=UPI001668414E|nr:hypothetical protein [Edaphobacter acidisoli]
MCEQKRRAVDGGPLSRSGRGTQASGVVLPGVLMVLVPKCPMCVAAYLAMAGVGISVSAAAWLRWGVLAACVVTMVVFAGLALRRKMLVTS